jgi:PleD family two-component response regulator
MMVVTASFGVTDYRDDEVLEETIKRADLALYQAKHDGRDRTIVF